jgi:hypothetical protein
MIQVDGELGRIEWSPFPQVFTRRDDVEPGFEFRH